MVARDRSSVPSTYVFHTVRHEAVGRAYASRNLQQKPRKSKCRPQCSDPDCLP
jgi:hypothetical protein